MHIESPIGYFAVRDCVKLLETLQSCTGAAWGFPGPLFVPPSDPMHPCYQYVHANYSLYTRPVYLQVWLAIYMEAVCKKVEQSTTHPLKYVCKYRATGALVIVICRILLVAKYGCLTSTDLNSASVYCILARPSSWV